MLAYTSRTDGTSTNNNVDAAVLGGLQLKKTANKGEQTSIDVSYLKGLKFYVYKTTGNGGSYSSSDLVATGKITDIPLGWYVVVEDTDIANAKGTNGANIEKRLL